MVCTSEGRFLIAIRAVEFCSLGRSGGSCLSQSLYKALEFCVGFFFSSRFFDRRFILRRLVGRCCYRSCRRWRVLVGLHLFLYFFDARSTLFHRFLRDTCHSDGSTGVFWSCCSLHRPCGLLVTGAWLSCAREVFSLSSA